MCTASTLVAIGGLNWGLVAIGMFTHMNLNVVNLLLGRWPIVEAIVYLVVGIATVVTLIGCKCEKCAKCEMVCKIDAPKAM